MSRPLLTAAMIVRDEQQHLGACLASLEGVVEEVVIVDTGSSDRSVQIARSLGARVYSVPWAGDFSLARNAALELATGRWILYIDADERLRPIARADVEELLERGDEVAFRVLLRPFLRSTPYREYRLWRNDPRIRFRGVIHEKVAPAIWDVAAAEGRSVGDSSVALDHVGYDHDQARKHRRNLPLLRAQLADEPESVFNLRHLGAVLADLGDEGEAERALRRALELIRAAPYADRHGSLAYADLVRMLHGRRDDAADLLDEGLARYPDNWLLVWIKARAEIDAGRYELALSWLERLAAVDLGSLPEGGVAYDERLFGCFAHASRGLCLFRLGRYAEAASAYRAAEACEPANREYRVKRQLAELRA